MPESGEPNQSYKFAGFLSYSRADGEAVTRLHQRLESYVIPKSLRKTGAKTLGRFFQDKVELAASHEVLGELTEKLDQSRLLILCCSPDAGASHWVNEEVSHVLTNRGQESILAVILSGDEVIDTFPPALRSNPPLAADLRPRGDGEEIGFLKLVAGILDVDLGELIDRQAAAQRRQLQIRSFLIGLFAILAIAASVSAYQAIQQRDRAEKMALEAIDIGSGVVDRAGDLSRTYGVPTNAVEGLLQFAETRFNNLFELGVKNPELEQRQAILLLSFAEIAKRTGDVDAQKRYADAAITQFGDLLKRGEGIGGYYSRSLMASADAALAQGDDELGMKHYTDALAILRASTKDGENSLSTRTLFAGALYNLGKAKLRRQQATQALPLLNEALPLYEAIWQEQPELDINGTNLISCLDLLGGAQALNQETANAEATLNKAIAISQQWVADNPDSLTARSTLSISLMKKAQLESDANQLPRSIKTFEETIQASRDLVAKDPDNATQSQNLAFRLVLMAQTVQKSGDLTRAQTLANEGLQLCANQIDQDATNVEIRKSYIDMLHVGRSIAKASGDLPQMLAKSKTLAKTEADIRSLTNDSLEQIKSHAFALELVGDDSAQNKDLDSMLSAYEEAVLLRRILLKENPDSPDAQTSIAGTLHALGLTRKFAKDIEGAVAALTEAAKIRSTLAAMPTSEPTVAFAAADSYQQLATLQAGFDAKACEQSMQKAESLLTTLVQDFPDNATYQGSLKKTRDLLKMIQSAGGQ